MLLNSLLSDLTFIYVLRVSGLTLLIVVVIDAVIAAIVHAIPEKNIKKELSTTDTYNIIRQLDLIKNEENEKIRKKLTRLERILSDHAW